MIFENTQVIESCIKDNDFTALKNLYAPVCPARKDMPITAPLMVSAHQLKHLNKIDTLHTDSIIINLEDGVAKEHKKTALQLAALFVTHAKQTNKTVIVRTNALNEGAQEEIALLNSVKPDAIRIPKVCSKKDVALACTLIDKDIDIHLSIETAQAWRKMTKLKVHKRVTTFYLGILDLFSELSLDIALITPHNPLISYMLSHFLVTCKTMGITPVSFVYQEYKDIQTLKEFLVLEKTLGYRAKGVVSPTQAKEVMQFFGFDPMRIEKARYIVERFEAMQSQGVTGFVDDVYDFIDEPIYKASQALLKEYEIFKKDQ